MMLRRIVASPHGVVDVFTALTHYLELRCPRPKRDVSAALSQSLFDIPGRSVNAVGFELVDYLHDHFSQLYLARDRRGLSLALLDLPRRRSVVSRGVLLQFAAGEYRLEPLAHDRIRHIFSQTRLEVLEKPEFSGLFRRSRNCPQLGAATNESSWRRFGAAVACKADLRRHEIRYSANVL